MRVMNNELRISALFIATMFAAGALAQSARSFVYPAKGQSAEKQKKDEGECHTRALQQSKFDPAGWRSREFWLHAARLRHNGPRSAVSPMYARKRSVFSLRR